jgi:hypothetical protein
MVGNQVGGFVPRLPVTVTPLDSEAGKRSCDLTNRMRELRTSGSVRHNASFVTHAYR